VCSDKEKCLTGKDGMKDTSYPCTDCNVELRTIACFKIFHSLLVLNYEK
jgi:hypothetical protein